VKHRSRLSIIGLITLMALSVSAVGVGTAATTQAVSAALGTGDTDRQAIEQAALSEIVKYPSLQQPGFAPFQVGSIRLERDWAFLNLLSFPLKPDPEAELVVPVIVLAIAQQDQSVEWHVYVESTSEYRAKLGESPEKMLSDTSKAMLLGSSQLMSSPQQPTAVSIRGLPWPIGTAWRYNQSAHEPWGTALDFGTPSSGSEWVYTADEGTLLAADETCVAIRRTSDNLQLWYQHLNPTDVAAVAAWGIGNPVSFGQPLGRTTTDPGCRGYSTGHHLHFYFGYGKALDPQGSSLNGWVYTDGNLVRNGQTARPNMTDTVLHSAQGGDNTPPTISFTAPPSGQWYNVDQSIAWSVSDTGGSGVRGYKFAWDQNPPPGAEQSGASGSTNLSTATQGQHTLYVQAWDNAGNPSTVAVAGWFGYDTPPPTVNFTAQPANNRWYNSGQTISWSITDEAGGSGVRGYKSAWDQNPPQGTEQSGVSGSTTLSTLTQGQHTLYVQAWDNAGNPSTVAVAGWFGYDTSAPSNPSSTASGCTASNDVWQNTCADPNFTWSGASDGVGSGVKDYHYYWGADPNGAPSTYTSAASFDPPSVSGPVAAQYLRLSTRDNLNQESLPSTVFVFLYDASPPAATVQINHGAASANQVDVTLNLIASDTGSGVTGVRLSNNGQAWIDTPYASEIPWTLPALDRRPHTVYVQARDLAGNLSATVSDTIDLDLYPVAPHSTGYRICQDVLNIGGSTRITSTHYLLASAIGQPAASGARSTTSGSFSGQSGFLANLTGCLPITYTATSNYTLTQWVIASAGNVRGSASYRLGDTAGQPLASGAAMFSSTAYRMSSGFWAAITATIPMTRVYLPLILK